MLCFSTALHGVVAQTNITIRGTADNAVGKVVMLGGYSDKISHRELIFDKTVIGDDRQFELRCFARYPMLVFLQVEHYSQSFYVVPGGDYRVEIPAFDWKQDETTNVFLSPVTLPVVFTRLPDDDPNAMITNVDRAVNRYLVEHRVHFDERYRPDKAYFDTLLMVVDKACPDGENDFVNRYKRFSLAQLRLDLKMASRTQIYNTYLRNQPVLCYDENYMTLFTSLYRHSISKGSRRISQKSVARWVNSLDYNTFIDSLGVEPLLRHEQIRELAALQALQEMLYQPHTYAKENVVAMVEHLRDRTKFADHRPLAQNVLDGLGALQAGEEQPALALPDVEKQTVSLADLRGNWVYLSFVRVGDVACLGEIETLAFFKDTVYAENKDVRFVSVSCDREFQKMYHFLKNNRKGDRYDWTWLHFAGDYELLQRYRVVTYPTFLLIDPEGRIVDEYAPAPSTGYLLRAPWRKEPEREAHDGNYFDNN